MSNYDMDQLMGTYADWIAWLKEKEASLEGQLARMRGKSAGKPGSMGERAITSQGAGVQEGMGEPVAGSGEREAIGKVPAGEDAQLFAEEALPSDDAFPSSVSNPKSDNEEEDDWL